MKGKGFKLRVGSCCRSIHDKLKGWLAYVVLGAIGLVFVFWGINWTLSAPTYAAKVNGSEISANEVRQSYQQQLAQVERQTNVPLDEAQRNEIKCRVLEDYVNSEALVTRADKLGYRVSDEDCWPKWRDSGVSSRRQVRQGTCAGHVERAGPFGLRNRGYVSARRETAAVGHGAIRLELRNPD